MNLVGDAIAGGATNATGAAQAGPYSVAIYCLDGNEIVNYNSDYAEPVGDLEDGETVTFTSDLCGGKCASYVVGVDGYFS